jgi:hypothetical protein
LLERENAVTLDRQNVGADELTTALAFASGWISLMYARRRREHLEKTNARYKTSRLELDTPAEGTEARQIWFETRT